MVKELWMLKNKHADLNRISNKHKISELISKLIVNRGINSDDEIERYIKTSYESLHNPKTMKDIDVAVDILKQKINNGDKIRIIGDYDVDGIISVFILYTALKKVGANVDYEIPDRIKDGYGINENIIDEANKDRVNTIVTCDNGISAIQQIEYAKKIGLTVIVTDHHDIPFIEENGERKFVSPNADAIINPKQMGCDYKFKKICGAGVAFKLIQVLFGELGLDESEAYKLIEFVAIATVCDVVELIDENRVFVKKGLELLNETDNIGLRALKKVSSLEDNKLSAYHLGFVIGPCLNASGRLDSAKKGLELLLCDDEARAFKLANEILELNNQRKDMTKNGVEKAIEIIESTDIVNDRILVVYIEDIHESIAGIIAGRIKERYNKPTIILTKTKEGVKGSARSIEAYNIFEGLTECKGILDKFGGHPMAAGLSLKEENIDSLRNMLNDKSKLTDDDLIKKIQIDLALGLNDLNIALIEDLEILEPFGTGNNKPVFGIKNVKILNAIKVGKNQNVLKLKIKNNNNIIDAVAFSGIEDIENKIIDKYGNEALAGIYNNVDKDVYMDLIFYPNINEWNGRRSVQIIINSIR